MKNINIYRATCIKYLESRQEYFFEEVDYYIDLALRQVSKLPLKPDEDDEYNGLVGMKPIMEQRILCLGFIKKRLKGDSVQLADLSLDSAVRRLNKLPKRPKGNNPYEALFRLEPSDAIVETPKKETGVLRTSSKGIDLIHSFESYRECTYKDPGSASGLPITGGWGSTRLNGKKLQLGQCYSRDIWDAQFERDLKTFEDAVNKYVTVSLNENQFSALVSWTYNCGIGALIGSTGLKRLNNKNYKKAWEAFSWFNKGGNGKVLPGLVKRRQAEGKLFFL